MTDDERADEIPRRRFYQTQERAHAILSEYRGLALDGGAPESYKSVMGRACLDYVAALRKHRTETAIKDEWEDLDEALAPIRQAVGQQVPVEIEATGDTSATETVYRPAIRRIPFGYMEQVIEELDDLAKNLGLSESVRDETPADEATISDLRGLLKSRGQTEALQNLPGSDDGEVAD
jgi:hypothetical protein